MEPANVLRAGKLRFMLSGSARAYLYRTIEEIWSDAVEGRKINMDQKARVQLAATNAVVSSAEAVDLVHAAAGSSGIREENRFQRYFRDVHTISQHAFVFTSRYDSVGQVLVGLTPEWPFFGM